MVVGDAHDCDLRNVGMLHEGLFDFTRVDVLAAADDDLTQPSVESQQTSTVHRAHVAGMEPAVRVDDVGADRGVTDVTIHGHGRSGAELADLLQHRGLGCAGPDDADVPVRQRLADGFRLVEIAVVQPGLGDAR